MRSRKIMVFIVSVCSFLLITTSLLAADAPKFSGYIKSAFIHTEKASETEVSNARVKAAGSIDDKTKYTVFFDLVRDDTLLDAYIDREIVDNLSVKIGQFKTPFSSDNLLSSAKLAFINRPYMKKDVSPAFRDKGLQFTYKHKYFDAVAAVMNGSGQNADEYNNNKSMAYRVVAKVLPQLNISGNFYTGNNSPVDTETDDFVNVGANGRIGDVEYSAEYGQKSHDELTSNAFFAWLSYDIEMDNDLISILTPGVRVEMSDPDIDTDDDAKSRYTFGLSADFDKKYANRVLLNYEIRELETGEEDNMLGLEYVVIF